MQDKILATVKALAARQSELLDILGNSFNGWTKKQSREFSANSRQLNRIANLARLAA